MSFHPFERPAAKRSVTGNGRRGNLVLQLLMLLEREAMLFRNQDGEPFADMIVGKRLETWPIESIGFSQLAIRRCREALGRVPSRETLALVVAALAASAAIEGSRRVDLRVAKADGKLYLDLADHDCRVIEISPEGWRLVTHPPVRFARSLKMQALPVPQAGASIELLREFINVTNDEDFILVVAWLASAVRASTEYPILTLCGQSGAAKSTGARCLKRLIDPYALSERGPPRNELELYVACHQTHVVGLDNLSKIPPWLADALCRVATGAGFACRTHYTNRDETIFHGGRPIITTSINHLMDREDLAARNLLIEVSEIPENKRLTSAEYWEKFDAARPQLLGAVLDVVVHGLKTLPTLSFGRRPRMAEFAVFAQACEGAISQVAGSFERAYAGNRQRSAEEIVDADLVGTAVCKLMEKRRAFEGTAADLLVTLSRLLSEEQRRSPDWPLVPNRLSNRIKNLAQALHMVGIEVRRGYQGDGRQSRRKIILRAEDR